MAKKTRRGRRIRRPATQPERDRFERMLAEENPDVLQRQGRESLQRVEARQADLSRVISALRSAREERGISLTQLSAATGITKGNLSRLENSPRPNPTLDTLQRYAAGIGCRLSVTVSSS